MSASYRKDPDHHWMTLLRVTKHNWSRPTAANGPERNSPGWVMTVFSAFLFTPFWCPRTPHLTPAATSPVSSQYSNSHHSVPPGPLLSSTLTRTSTQSCGPSVCEQQMQKSEQAPYVWMRGGRHAFSSTVEAARIEILPSLAHTEPPNGQFKWNLIESKIILGSTNIT